jgi:ribosomal protein L11 methyltransferase
LSWAELALVVPRHQLDRISTVLFALGALGLQEDFLPGEAPPVRQPWDTGPAAVLPERVLLRGWWDVAGFGSARERVAAEVAGLSGVGAPEWSTLADGGWEEAWRDHVRPVRVCDGLVFSPPWCAEEGDLLLEPGMAFGSGEHPTTRAMLQLIARRAQPGQRCLDVGTGSGILAMAAAHLGMGVHGVDTDPQAVQAAAENLVKNQLQGRIDAARLEDLGQPFELVVANLYAEVLVVLAPQLVRLCGGTLGVAGVLAEKVPMVKSALNALELIDEVPAGDWVSLEYRP